MKVAGFTIIRNAIKFDYSVVEAITSILDICDVFYVGLGNSEDDTRQLLLSIESTKIKIIDTFWDDALREGGKVLADETNKIFDAIPTEYDWCFYIQSDECIHEQDINTIQTGMQKYLSDYSVEGLLFEYKHFYGDYKYIGIGRRWYKHEIRIIRNDKTIRSYKDAQGFRKINGEKLKVKKIDAFIHHYGWVKPPKAQQEKQKSFHKMWHNDEWVKNHVDAGDEYDYSNIDLLALYEGSHPQVFKKRIEKVNWQFVYDRKKVKTNFKYQLLFWVEKLCGWRIGENRNYKII